MQSLSQTTNSNPTQACAEELLDALPPMIRFVRKHMRRGTDMGLSMPQFRTLALLRAFPNTNLSLVAEHLGASLPTASRMVTCMVSKGFIRRRECAGDRRNVELVLTGRGAEIMNKSRKSAQAQLVRELRSLSSADQRTVIHAMKLMQKVFNPAVDGN
ncbi:MAG TPA: MarR family transcriptional regulator [Tepidisphaeraceae bacterium]|nr:MarR family transcriptional regulator [Tepidisphaeraceae bacterium]